MEKGNNSPQDKGLRFNEGKLRYDLFEPYAMEQLANIFTYGSKKYEANNWLKGMPWTSILASLKRHTAAFEKGEDYDKESGLPHMAHVAWNALALVSYSKYHPHLDDRYAFKRKLPKIGLDIDDVICSWVETWCEYHKIEIPKDWYFMWDIVGEFEDMRNRGVLDDFYRLLPVKEQINELPFSPECYISHRPVSDEITKEWLKKHGFPLKPVFHVKSREDKVRVAKEQGLDIFVDDNFDTFNAMNQAGICCYLLDAEHNRKYNVGDRRIKSLKELIK